ncbi:protein Skeletor, isoforms B/C [Phlebotomus argentipes]|uniref:protein Skeletor, isoforms B/C n=1 Tax=Phlebotomus argentipes TaxID=94469 RepID=UPI0028935028|nr:protein Skeletor, isoforms B/C [Phlebotomus argentipes]
MMNYRDLLGLICGILLTYVQVTQAQGYYGIKIGALTQLHHGVSGDVYAVDARTIFLKNFNYDGEGPTAYFYVGNTRRPNHVGAWRLRDERGSTGVLRRYRNKDITLSLPEGKTLRDIKWFSVWCDEFTVNFGDVTIPKNLEFPRPQKIAPLNGVHGVSSDNVVIVDAQTLLVPNFNYDGEAPDAKFWVGRGVKPSPHGIRIPDENGKETPLRKYDRKTIVLTLPGELTVFDIGHFGVWCEAFTVDFGHVRIPEGIVVPPSLKMLGVSPQSKLNCEVLFDDLAFEVRWAVAGESVVVQLVAKLDSNEYMSFGVSPDPKKTVMVGADVAVAWVDKSTGKGYAYDYILDDKSQCSGQRGSCPDSRLDENTNSIRLLNAAMVNGYSIVTFQRPLKASDGLDLPIFTNGSQAIVWAIGPLNQRQEVSFHSQYTKDNRLIDFGRQPIWNCPTPDNDGKSDEPEEESVEEEYYERRASRRPEQQAIVQDHQSNRRQEIVEVPRPVPTPRPANKNGAWDIPPIQCYEPEDGVFYAQMGPTGGKQGYPAITGHVGWGISWYINGLLIPEINVVRGKTYTFVVEGGFDPDIPAKYHPFYITDDPIGGYEYKTDEEKANVKIFAGAHRSRNGVITPIGVGRLCNWTPDPDGPGADEYTSFGAYQRSLTLKCDAGEPGIITWTPDDNTPDTVYYQCFTHRHLGWKINVLDTCDEAHPSELDEVYASPESSEGIEAESSIRHETKLRPTDNFLFQHESDLIKNHNMNSSPPKIQFEVPGNSDITKLISDGIRAAELLEEEIARPNRTTTTPPPPPSPESMNEGEQIPVQSPKQPEIKVPSPHYLAPSPGPGLPVYLRPPQNGQFFRPVKVPLRRNPGGYTFERRPIVRPYNRPYIVPQPSMLVSHYQKPVLPSFLRPFVKVKQAPIKPIATVLLLGEPTEIKPLRQVPEKVQATPLRIPYLDTNPMSIKKSDYPMAKPMLTSKLPPPIASNIKEPILPDKKYPPIKYSVAIDSKELQSTYKPATNTGFQPEKVIVEGGFKPIMKRRKDEERIEDEEKKPLRRVDIISEIDEAIEGDALFINQDQQPNRAFEPMFIPSPPDRVDNASPDTSPASSATPNPTEDLNDLADMEFEEGEDKMAVAAERFDTFYLPPDNKKHRPQQKYPEGTVVAFDGKAVLDTSLINSAPTNEVKQPFFPSGLSKTEQLLSTPQFGPFRGEVPLQFKSNDPHPQAPVTEYSNPLTNSAAPISTKLTLLRAEDSQISSENGG